MIDQSQQPLVPMNPFLEKRMMRSFDDFFKVCASHPVEARDYIAGKLARSDVPYPHPHAVLYMTGMMAGILSAATHGVQNAFDGLVQNHQWALQFKPGDYLGNDRKYARANPPPGA